MKRLILSGLVAFSVWQSLAFADDTDIYLTTAADGPKPFLMLTFDYRNDMAATFCNSLSACRETVGLESGQADEESPLLMAMKDITGDTSLAKVNSLQALLAVLQVVFDKYSGIYVGLMVPNKNNGGSILRGFKEFQVGDANGAKAELLNILNLIPTPSTGNAYHDVSPKEMHYEFWRYLNGGNVALGDQTADNFPGLPAPPADITVEDPYALLRPDADGYYTAINNPVDNDDVVKDTNGNGRPDQYISPFDPATDYACVKLFEIYTTSGNAGLNGDSDLDSQIGDSMQSTTIDVTDPNFTGMVSWMANNDMVDWVAGEQTLKTWFIQMGTASTQADDWARTMATSAQDQRLLEVSGRGTNLKDLQAAIEAFFVEAISTSSTFVSASVPVNVFNRIETLDNFYIALFEANAKSRWPGNLKKLKLVDEDTPPDGNYDEIKDANGKIAFDNDTGRILFDRLTFWTDAAALPPANPDRGEVDNRDGRAVARGGAGQKIPGFITNDLGSTTAIGPRQLYLEPASVTNGASNSFVTFDSTTLASDADVQTLLGVTTATDATSLISWARGIDEQDEDNDNQTNVRGWILGDAIHSRPLALNYGATTGYTESKPNIRLFMGTNDGFFHIFEDMAPGTSTLDGNGNPVTTPPTESGKELFAFMPRESLPNLQQLYDDTALSPDGSSVTHPYGVDGEPVALVVDDDRDGTVETGDEVYVYVGMRRGGRSYYALNASNPDAVPSLQWKITKTSGGNFDELGYTFSTPRVAKVQYGSNPVDVLIFAGGYDMNKDDPSISAGTDTEGNAIYIVNARTGALIWKAVDGIGSNTDTTHYNSGLDHSIPSSVATLDSNGNGIVDRAYVGDMGGNVWRIDLPEGNQANHRQDNWEITKLAALGGNTEAEDRRFFHAPDVVQTKDENGNYDGILLTSGDRASPKEVDDDNYLYLIKDRSTRSGNPPASVLGHAELTDTTACITGTETGTVNSTTYDCSNMNYDKGWKIELKENGEKGLASPLTVDGKAYFTTYRPHQISGATCEPTEGKGALFKVNLKDGTAIHNKRDQEIGPGIPPQVTPLGSDGLLFPGAGELENPDDPNNQNRDKVGKTDGKGMYIIYWREPGVDKL